MKYTLYYAHAKLKAVKGKSLRGNTGIVHFSIKIEPLKKNILVISRKENRQIGEYIFALNSTVHSLPLMVNSMFVKPRPNIRYHSVLLYLNSKSQTYTLLDVDTNVHNNPQIRMNE